MSDVQQTSVRVRLASWIIRHVVIRLVGRPVQIIRQDARGGGLHHAPMCGANHYHHTRPLTSACTCGAEKQWRLEQGCTGLSAAWCPIHGDCICDRENGLDHEECPLHNRGSQHPLDSDALVELRHGGPA